ncbi:MAG: DUF4124 domain-containing protein [Pseudomonadota bacterium]
MQKTIITALALAGALLVQGAAQAQGVYLCVSASGGKELTDTYRAGCKALEVPGSISAPAPRARSAAKTVSAPTDFPKVDNAQQKARDSDRREILETELGAEEARLTDLRAEYKNGTPDKQGPEAKNYAKYQERVAQMAENIARAEKNVDALRREIANIK